MSKIIEIFPFREECLMQLFLLCLSTHLANLTVRILRFVKNGPYDFTSIFIAKTAVLDSFRANTDTEFFICTFIFRIATIAHHSLKRKIRVSQTKADP